MTGSELDQEMGSSRLFQDDGTSGFPMNSVGTNKVARRQDFGTVWCANNSSWSFDLWWDVMVLLGQLH